MKMINKFIYLTLFLMLTISTMDAASRDIDVQKGWSQLTVPYDNVKVDLLVAEDNIDVIWARQNGRYKIASRNSEYIDMANDSYEIGIIRGLSYGESIYVFAKEDTTITFVGQENHNPPVRSDHLTSMWQQMSRDDFKSTKWNVISKIAEGQLIIASKIVMKDGRPSIKVYSNDPTEVAKINPEFFEDFEVSADESFWIKDVTNVNSINKFDFSVLQTPNEGGDMARFAIEATSTSKNKSYLAVRIVAFKDGDPSNKEHILFDDYIKLNQGVQEIPIVMPMLLSSDFGSYRVYAIKDLAAQYDTVGIDLYNIADEDPADVESAYRDILQDAEYITVGLNGNNSDVVYSMKMESREYANSVLYYDPLKELNKLAQNQSKDLSEFTYSNIPKHTEFQLSIEAYGNGGVAIKSTKVKAYLTVDGTPREIVVMSDRSRLEDSYQLDYVEITLPDEKHSVDLVLPLMLYGVEGLQDSTDKTLYDDVMSQLKADNDKYKICLDSSCSQWIFKREFTVGFAVADASDGTTEPTAGDIIGSTKVTLYSDTFSEKKLNDYESKDTTISLLNLLLKEDTYNNENDKRRIGIVGAGAGTTRLIDDLSALQKGLADGADAKSLFDPLVTYEQSLVDMLLYNRDAEGAIDVNSVADTALHGYWDTYTKVADVINHLCDRKSYFTLTVPYSKEVNDPDGGNDIDILTATGDLCLYNVEYSYLNTLTASEIGIIADNFHGFVTVKNSRNEEDRVADFWNPLFTLNNATLHMPESFMKTMPIINKKMGGAAVFSSKMAIDSELNELRTNAYVDVDVALIKDFKILDLDFETVISGSDTEASRFDFSLYSINPTDDENAFAIKKIFVFHQKIHTTYQNDKTIDMTFVKGKSIHFQLGPVPVFFEFEIGLYSFFKMGIHVDITDHLMVYAIPGARIFGTLAGGLGIDFKILSLDIGIILDDFTVIRASVPVVAILEDLRLDKNGFSSVFKLYGNVEMRALELTVGVFGRIKVSGKSIVNLTIDIFSYDGFSPLKLAGLTVGEGKPSDKTKCQEAYYGFELFCIKKELKLEFKFSGLTTAECKLLDDEYLRRAVYDGDTTYLYSTNEYRKVRGCTNDGYEFANVSLDTWMLSDTQMDDVNNVEFWKWDSRALISQEIEAEIEEDPYATPWADAWNTSDDGNTDDVHERWKALTGYEW